MCVSVFCSVDKAAALCYHKIHKEVLTMNVLVNFSDKEAEFIKSYADRHGISVEKFMKMAVLERIEDDIDLKTYNEAIEEYNKEPVSHSLDELEKELGL